MAKKRLNRKDLDYFVQAAKMIVYPVDHTDKLIDVPDGQIDDANENLTVQHLQSFGYAIQVVMAIEETKIFDPQLKKRTYTEQQQLYQAGDRFSLVVGFKTVEITEVKGDKLYYKSVGVVNRAPGVMKIEDLERAIKNNKAYKK